MNHDDLLAHYVTPGVFTGVAGFEAQIDSLPSDAASIARVVQGLLIHEGGGRSLRHFSFTRAQGRQAAAWRSRHAHEVRAP